MEIRRGTFAAAATAVLVGGFAFAGGGTGNAATVTVRIGDALTGCSVTVPGVGALRVDITNHIEVDAPDTATLGVPTAPLPYRGTATTSLDFGAGTPLRQAFEAAGVVTLDATAQMALRYRSPQYPNTERPRAAVTVTGVPIAGRSALPEWDATGERPPIVFDQAGTQPTLYYQSFNILITPRGADGGTTTLGTLDAHCIYPPGPYSTHRVEVSPAGRHVTHAVTAQTTIARTEVDLGAGTLDLDLPGTGTATTGALALPNAGTAALKVLGVIPATATVRVTPGGPLAGTIDGDALTATTAATVTVPDFAILGIPLLKGDPDCASSTTLALTSAAGFTPTTGGPITGSYDLPAFTGCGPYDGLITALFAGTGNALAIDAS